MLNFYRYASYMASALAGRLLFRLLTSLRRPVIRAPKGPYVLVCNHISHFDPLVLAFHFPHHIHFMAMSELFATGWSDFYMRSCGSFPVSRNEADSTAVREAIRRLKEGHVVGIFPEKGIRSGQESIIGGAEPALGAATLAQMAGVPMRVVLVIGTDQLYRWQNLLRRPRVYVLAGGELLPDASLPKKEARTKLAREMAEEMRRVYGEFLEREKPDARVLPHSAQERWREGI